MARAVIEQLLLAVGGGAAGIWVAWVGLTLFVRTAPIDLPRVNEVTLDGRVLAFAAAISVLAGVLVAALASWRTNAAQDIESPLRASSIAVGLDKSGLRARAALLSLQVGLSVALLVVTALVGASFLRVMRIDRGFDPEHVGAVEVMLPGTRYADEKSRLAVYDRLLASIQAQPGVITASTTSLLPLTGQGQINFIAPDGSRRPRSEQPSANFRFVAPTFFQTLGLAILRGRAFTDAERDPGRPAPALVSEPAAASLWPGEDPLGRRFSRGIEGEQGFEVVGIVADARTTSLESTPPLMVYVPYWWRGRASTSLLVKASGDAAALMPAIRRVVRGIDPEIALGEPMPLEHLVDRSTAGRRYQTKLMVAFGAVALFIATVGVYSVTAFALSRRRREMNIRLALGARPAQVLRLIVAQGSAPIAVGIAAGVGLAVAGGRSVASLLFDVRPNDPFVLIGVTALVGIVATLACVLAARGALTIDPAQSLKSEV
jgi:putative ABC transport system permease protein